MVRAVLVGFLSVTMLGCASSATTIDASGDGTSRRGTPPTGSESPSGPETEAEAAPLSLDAGAFHACLVTASGGVKCWGANDSGQLGDGTREPRVGAVDVVGVTDAAQVSVQSNRSCAVTRDGRVTCWGGSDIDAEVLRPRFVEGLTGVRSLSLGLFHACALLEGGGVSCWGRTLRPTDPLATNVSTPTPVAGLDEPAVAIASGVDFSCAILASERVACFGSNAYGELGNGTTGGKIYPPQTLTLSTITSIALGVSPNACASNDAGDVWCWGENGEGHPIATKPTSMPSPTRLTALSDVAMLAVGRTHGCALSTSGAVRCWGRLPSGDIAPPEKPADIGGLPPNVRAIAAGFTHTCAMTDDRVVYCWGLGPGLGGAPDASARTPVRVAGL